MPKWKCGATIVIIVNTLLAVCLIDDYYEVFIKECRDAFPFGYCPWGAESLGPAWRSPDAYWNTSVTCLGLLVLFLLAAVYAYHRRRYGCALFLAVAPLIINGIWAWLE